MGVLLLAFVCTFLFQLSAQTATELIRLHASPGQLEFVENTDQLTFLPPLEARYGAAIPIYQKKKAKRRKQRRGRRWREKLRGYEKSITILYEHPGFIAGTFNQFTFSTEKIIPAQEQDLDTALFCFFPNRNYLMVYGFTPLVENGDYWMRRLSLYHADYLERVNVYDLEMNMIGDVYYMDQSHFRKERGAEEMEEFGYLKTEIHSYFKADRYFLEEDPVRSMWTGNGIVVEKEELGELDLSFLGTAIIGELESVETAEAAHFIPYNTCQDALIKALCSYCE